MTYQVVFTGELRSGHDRRQGIQYLSQKFNLSFDRIKTLLSGTGTVVKELETRVQAEALVEVFWQGGWVTELLGEGGDDGVGECGSPEIEAPESFSEPVEKTERLYSSNFDGASNCSLELPGGWQVCAGLNAGALIQAGNTDRNQFLVVLRQAKRELTQSIGLPGYCSAQLQQCMGKVMEGREVRPAEACPDTDFSLYSGDFSAVVSGTRIHYLVAVSENKANFFTHIFWCEQSGFEQAKSVFWQILRSFVVDSSCEAGTSEVAVMKSRQPVEA